MTAMQFAALPVLVAVLLVPVSAGAAATATQAGPALHPAQAPHGSTAGHPVAAHGDPQVRSNVALVVDAALGTPLYAKHQDQVAPIASITKLMTAMVLLDAGVPADEIVTIDKADVDHVKNTKSRLPVGAGIPRGELLRVALMSSDNRAAAALARTYPGGTAACVAAMNRKAAALEMPRTSFADPTGLSSHNVSNAQDLTRMVLAASSYPAIREATTSALHHLTLTDGRVLEFHNSNGLVRNPTWSIGLSKTGYINEAGRCLVMQAEIAAKQVVIVLLDSWGKYTRLGDANRIRHWMEAAAARTGASAPAPAAVEAPAPLRTSSAP
jgi:D-alanyl-D-alanine endopeptidase (penicillin-binding protein 7)